MANAWRITVKGCMKAHFLQKLAPSKPGADWAVELHDGTKEYRVMVRAYAEDVRGMSAEQEAGVVVEFLGKLIEQGWTPLEYAGEPGELTFKAQL